MDSGSSGRLSTESLGLARIVSYQVLGSECINQRHSADPECKDAQQVTVDGYVIRISFQCTAFHRVLI